jgi:hypothetical protein
VSRNRGHSHVAPLGLWGGGWALFYNEVVPTGTAPWRPASGGAATSVRARSARHGTLHSPGVLARFLLYLPACTAIACNESRVRVFGR